VKIEVVVFDCVMEVIVCISFVDTIHDPSVVHKSCSFVQSLIDAFEVP
jgi:hypothetical protein